MKIKMLEHFQGRNQPTLSEGTEHDSADIGDPLCEWLLEHQKAVDITPAPPPKPAPKPKKKPATRARKPRGRAANEDN